jgi:hypothetical protein
VNLGTGSRVRNPLPAVRQCNRSAALQGATIDGDPRSTESAVSTGREELANNRVI